MKKNRNLITGGAGFIGSHLTKKLLSLDEEVICLDNYFTGRKSNVHSYLNNPNFELIRHDVTEPIQLEVDKIWHLACPASPKSYQSNPIKTSKTCFLGTYNMLGLARRVNAKFLMASTRLRGNLVTTRCHLRMEDCVGAAEGVALRLMCQARV